MTANWIMFGEPSSAVVFIDWNTVVGVILPAKTSSDQIEMLLSNGRMIHIPNTKSDRETVIRMCGYITSQFQTTIEVKDDSRKV